MQWFRFYNDALNDIKVQSLSPELFKSWVNILCVASHSGEGILPSPSQVAFHLRVSESQCVETISALVQARLLDETPQGVIPHNWTARQYKSDISRERTQKYRAKRRELGLTSGFDHTKFREDLIKRDGYSCSYCGARKNLVVDHMLPICFGGTDDINNLTLACKACNSGKAGNPLEKSTYVLKKESAAHAYNRYMSRDVTVTTSPQNRSRTEQKKPLTPSSLAQPPPPAVRGGGTVDQRPEVRQKEAKSFGEIVKKLQGTGT